MGRMQRNKGVRGELEAAREIRRIFGVYAERGQQRSGSADSPDVKSALEGIYLEVKRKERIQLYPALDKAVSECGDARPIIMHRKNRRPWLVTMRLDDLPSIIDRLYPYLLIKYLHEGDEDGRRKPDDQ